MLGLLACIVLNARDRFNTIQILVLVIITFIFMIVTWVNWKKRVEKKKNTILSINHLDRWFRETTPSTTSEKTASLHCTWSSSRRYRDCSIHIC